MNWNNLYIKVWYLETSVPQMTESIAYNLWLRLRSMKNTNTSARVDIGAAFDPRPLVTSNILHWFWCFWSFRRYLSGSSTEITYGELIGISQRYTYEPHWACARNPRTYGPHLTHPLISGSQIQHLKSSGQIQHLKSSGEVCLKYS